MTFIGVSNVAKTSFQIFAYSWFRNVNLIIIILWRKRHFLSENKSGSEVIKIMLNSNEHEIYPAHNVKRPTFLSI